MSLITRGLGSSALITRGLGAAGAAAPPAVTQVGRDLASSYAIRQAVSRDLASSYGIRETVGRDLASSYDIAAPSQPAEPTSIGTVVRPVAGGSIRGIDIHDGLLYVAYGTFSGNPGTIAAYNLSTLQLVRSFTTGAAADNIQVEGLSVGLWNGQVRIAAYSRTPALRGRIYFYALGTSGTNPSPVETVDLPPNTPAFRAFTLFTTTDGQEDYIIASSRARNSAGQEVLATVPFGENLLRIQGIDYDAANSRLVYYREGAEAATIYTHPSIPSTGLPAGTAPSLGTLVLESANLLAMRGLAYSDGLAYVINSSRELFTVPVPGPAPPATTEVGRDLETSYDIVEAVGRNLETSYDIAAAITDVGRSLETSYDIHEAVHRDLETNYGIRQAVHRDLESNYDVIEAVHRDLETSYDVAAAIFDVGRDLESSYDIIEAVGRDLETSYGILVPAGRTLATSYAIRQAVGRDLETSYDIAAGIVDVGKDLTSSYDIISITTPTLVADLGGIGAVEGLSIRGNLLYIVLQSSGGTGQPVPPRVLIYDKTTLQQVRSFVLNPATGSIDRDLPRGISVGLWNGQVRIAVYMERPVREIRFYSLTASGNNARPLTTVPVTRTDTRFNDNSFTLFTTTDGQEDYAIGTINIRNSAGQVIIEPMLEDMETRAIDGIDFDPENSRFVYLRDVVEGIYTHPNVPSTGADTLAPGTLVHRIPSNNYLGLAYSDGLVYIIDSSNNLYTVPIPTLQAVGRDLSTSYDIAEARVLVSRDLATSYDIIEAVSKPLASEYTIMEAAGRSLETSYAIHVAVGRDLETSYDIAELMDTLVGTLPSLDNTSGFDIYDGVIYVASREEGSPPQVRRYDLSSLQQIGQPFNAGSASTVHAQDLTVGMWDGQLQMGALRKATRGSLQIDSANFLDIYPLVGSDNAPTASGMTRIIVTPNTNIPFRSPRTSFRSAVSFYITPDGMESIIYGRRDISDSGFVSHGITGNDIDDFSVDGVTSGLDYDGDNGRIIYAVGDSNQSVIFMRSNTPSAESVIVHHITGPLTSLSYYGGFVYMLFTNGEIRTFPLPTDSVVTQVGRDLETSYAILARAPGPELETSYDIIQAVGRNFTTSYDIRTAGALPRVATLPGGRTGVAGIEVHGGEIFVPYAASGGGLAPEVVVYDSTTFARVRSFRLNNAAGTNDNAVPRGISIGEWQGQTRIAVYMINPSHEIRFYPLNAEGDAAVPAAVEAVAISGNRFNNSSFALYAEPDDGREAYAIGSSVVTGDLDGTVINPISIDSQPRPVAGLDYDAANSRLIYLRDEGGNRDAVYVHSTAPSTGPGTLIRRFDFTGAAPAGIAYENTVGYVIDAAGSIFTVDIPIDISSDLETSYAIHEAVGRTITASYDIHEAVHRDFESNYGILEAVGRDFETSYRIGLTRFYRARSGFTTAARGITAAFTGRGRGRGKEAFKASAAREITV